MIALYHTSEGFFATDNTCPHRGGPLAEGDLIDACLPGPKGDRPPDNPPLDKALAEAVDRLEGEVTKFVDWFVK